MIFPKEILKIKRTALLFVKQNRPQTKFSLFYDNGNGAFLQKNVLEKAKNIDVVVENRKKSLLPFLECF